MPACGRFSMPWGKHTVNNSLGTEKSVLWESSEQMKDGTWQLSGLTSNYLRVIAKSDQDRWNQIAQVKISGLDRKRNGLKGEILPV